MLGYVARDPRGCHHCHHRHYPHYHPPQQAIPYQDFNLITSLKHHPASIKG